MDDKVLLKEVLENPANWNRVGKFGVKIDYYPKPECPKFYIGHDNITWGTSNEITPEEDNEYYAILFEDHIYLVARYVTKTKFFLKSKEGLRDVCRVVKRAHSQYGNIEVGAQGIGWNKERLKIINGLSKFTYDSEQYLSIVPNGNENGFGVDIIWTNECLKPDLYFGDIGTKVFDCSFPIRPLILLPNTIFVWKQDLENRKALRIFLPGSTIPLVDDIYIPEDRASRANILRQQLRKMEAYQTELNTLITETKKIIQNLES